MIHGILEKKTFITYEPFYIIIRKDLKMIRVNCQTLEKLKPVQIRYKVNLNSSLNMSSSLKLFKVDQSSENDLNGNSSGIMN